VHVTSRSSSPQGPGQGVSRLVPAPPTRSANRLLQSMTLGQLVGSPLKGLAERRLIKRTFASPLVASSTGANAMEARPKGVARLFHMPNTRWSAPAPIRAGEASGLGEWRSSRREETVRQLEKWQAPALANEAVETLAAIFLRRPEHKLIPFFVWLEKRLRR
jgi:hypothetical protein